METTYYATTRRKELDVPKRKESAVGKGVLRSNEQCSFAPEGPERTAECPGWFSRS